MFGTFQRAWVEARDLGVGRALHGLNYRIWNRLLDYQVLKGMKITRVDPAFLSGNERYQYRFLDRATLQEFARDPQYGISAEFSSRALLKGDQCFGILDGKTLASYGWYSNKPTRISPELVLHFRPEYIYMYKGYTHPSYRGQRLHAIGMTRALQAYLEQGFEGLVSYVESNNYNSLKSVYRMGYEDIGTIHCARLFRRYLICHTPGCREYGLRLRPARADEL